MRTKAAARRTAAMRTKLYVTPTHPCRTRMLMLEHKGLPYRRVNLPAGLGQLELRAEALKAAQQALAAWWYEHPQTAADDLVDAVVTRAGPACVVGTLGRNQGRSTLAAVLWRGGLAPDVP
jgi:hypothetical protein